jgi:hypothetical protein
MKLAGRFGWTATLAAIVLVALLSAPRLSTSRALAIWIVIATALAMAALIRHARDRSRPEPASNFEQALRKPKPTTAQPEELLRMDRELVLGNADADHAHRRLLPLLRQTAATRLAARHGVELERNSESARTLLGTEAWELLRPDRAEPEDRHGPGLPREQIVAVIERVESL